MFDPFKELGLQGRLANHTDDPVIELPTGGVGVVVVCGPCRAGGAWTAPLTSPAPGPPHLTSWPHEPIDIHHAHRPRQ